MVQDGPYGIGRKYRSAVLRCRGCRRPSRTGKV